MFHGTSSVENYERLDSVAQHVLLVPTRGGLLTAMIQPQSIQLRAVRDNELAALSDLCFRSKAVWGYDAAFMEACRAELTLTPRDLAESHTQVAEIGGRVVGFAQVSVEGPDGSLEKLFAAPEALRSGVGRVLFAWVLATARSQGARHLSIESDPGAADFYRRMGARDEGVAPSGSIPGRFLPLLICDL